MPRPTTAACLGLGASLALLLAALPDAVLLPAVDRWPPRHLGLALTGLLVSAGWIAATRARASSTEPSAAPNAPPTPTPSLRKLVLLGLAALCGGFVSAWLVPVWREALAAALREPGSPYYPLVALACLTTAAPIALPLGALTGVALGAGTPRARVGLLLGAAAGFALGPALIELLLAATRTLQLVGLLSGCAAVLLIERRPLSIVSRRLPAPTALALIAAGGGALVLCRQLELGLDRGALVVPLFLTLACLGAALRALWPGLPTRASWLPPAIVMLALCTPSSPFVLARPGPIEPGDLALIGLVALAFGGLLGCATLGGETGRSGRTSVPLGIVPALLVLSAPLVSLILLPRLGPRGALIGLAGVAALPLLARAREHGVALVVLLTLSALALLGVGPGLPDGALPVIASLRLDDGLLGRVEDPATGRTLVALDGRAPLGLSGGQSRRFAHLPLLLHPAPRTTLVIAADSGETARAATWHTPQTLHWLQPLPIPADWLEAPWPGDDPPTSGSERQFLSVPRGPYDVIVMAPDLRAGRRAGLLGTVEFYALVQRRLAPGGLLCQWWDLSEVDLTDLKAVLAAGQQVFPYGYVALDQPRTRRACLAMLYSDAPLSVSPARIDAALASKRELAEDYEAIGLDGLAIACEVTADRGLLELLAPREEALHDDRPALGVRGALRRGGARERLLVGLRSFAQWRRDPMEWIDVLPPEVPPVAAIVRDRFRSWQHLFGGALAVVAVRGPTGIPFDCERATETPGEEAHALLDALVGLPDWDALRDAVLGVAAQLEAQGQRAAAEDYLRKAVSKDEGSAALRFALASVVERKGDAADALVLYRTVLAFEPGHAGALAAIAALESH